MPTVRAERQLLAAPQDVWDFLAQPERLADWWPGIAAVRPDRRGLAAGARWQVQGLARPSLVRRPDMTGTLVLVRVDPLELLAFHLTGERLDVELRLERGERGRTHAALTIRAPWFIGLRTSLARKALRRLHDVCQPGADDL